MYVMLYIALCTAAITLNETRSSDVLRCLADTKASLDRRYIDISVVFDVTREYFQSHDTVGAVRKQTLQTMMIVK